MPLDGWDHVELWVGNAKQAAYWYEHALGFERLAYAGPETGVRDRASYVLEQGEIRFVLTGALRESHDIGRHVSPARRRRQGHRAHGPGATEAYRQAVQRGARGVVEPHGLSRRARHASSSPRSRPTARRCTPSSNRGDYAGRVPARLRAARGRRDRRRRPARDRPHRRQRRARPHGPLGRVLRARCSG